mgnify:CR=1 FL=1
MPHTPAGPRIEPPVSEPIAPAQRPAATAAPEPLDEPAGMWSGFQGLRAAGQGRSCDGPPKANSWVASLPTTMAPAAFSRATVSASSCGTLSCSRREWQVVRTPAVE